MAAICGETPAGPRVRRLPDHSTEWRLEFGSGLSLGLPCDQVQAISPPGLSALSCKRGGCLAYLA